MPIFKKENYPDGYHRWTLTKQQMFNIRMIRDVMNNFISFVRTHLMVGFHVVGMLSSSWQGGDISGGKRREVIEEELTRKEYKKALSYLV